MKLSLIALGIVAIVVACGVFVYRWWTLGAEQIGGFRDWVKNPERRQAAEDYFAAHDAVTVPDDISDAEIQELVDRLFHLEDKDFNLRRLELVGPKAVPFLLRALEDPQAATARFPEGGHVSEAKSPFERICGLLEPLAAPAAAPVLASYIDHPDDHVRKHAALALGALGTAESTAPVLKALADEHEYVRSYAMMGIGRGIKEKRAAQEFREAMFPAIGGLLKRRDSAGSGSPPRLLLAIDRDRALPILLSPEHLTARNEQVHYILQALNEAGEKIPLEKLRPFLEETKPLIDKYPHDYSYAEALTAYALNPDGDAEGTFLAGLESPTPKIQTAAAKALAVLAGIPDPLDALEYALQRQGLRGLSLPQKHYLAVLTYNGEVRNGGHSQYFVNSSGDGWQDALAGLEAIGARERVQILSEAAALFGPNGPSTNNSKRHRQLADLSKSQDDDLETLDSKYYASKENIDTLLLRYACQHKEHFTRATKRAADR